MERKYFMILAIVAVLSIILLTGCVKNIQKNKEPSNLQEQKPETAAEIPPVFIEATVISLLEKDKAVIQVDKISSEHKIVDCDIMGALYPAPKGGDEITVPFYYGIGPAIIRTVPLSDIGNSNSDQDASSSDVVVSHTIGKVQKQEEDYLVTIIESSLVNETQEEILPGLEEGSKFKAQLYFTCVTDINIYKYELI